MHLKNYYFHFAYLHIIKITMPELPPFIHSLHRPFHQSLKATRWVCIFLNTRTKSIKSSDLNLEFYIYMIGFLNREYLKKQPKEYAGLPSKQALSDIQNYLSLSGKRDKIEEINRILKSDRNNPIEKQIYSTYKAASYYVNLAKDKFKLIDAKNNLTSDGLNLISIRSGVFNYVKDERHFFFQKILETDFLLFASLCYFIKLSDKYDFKDHIVINFDFLDHYYHIRHFNFTSSSLGNYNSVRSHWITVLQILDRRKNIKPSYVKLFAENEKYLAWDEDLRSRISDFEKKTFRDIRSLTTNIYELEKIYKTCIKKNLGDLGFVNLYDIKSNLRMSHTNFEILLNKFYEQEKGKKHIFFSNIVSSIDRRKRFMVRNVPVLKIKIK